MNTVNKRILVLIPQTIRDGLFVMLQNGVNVMITPYVLITVYVIGHLEKGAKNSDSSYRQKIQFSCLFSVHHALLWSL